jgi:hypothetical protein
MEFLGSEFLTSLMASAATDAGVTAATDAAITAATDAAATAATDAAATAATDAAATTAATAAADSTIPGILSGAGTASPEAIAAAEAQAAAPGILTGTASASPEAIAQAEAANVAPASDGILQASNAVYPEYGQLPQLGTETEIPGAEAANIGPNFNPVAPDATQVAEKGIGSYFDQGWKSASDLWDSASDKFQKGSDWIEAHPKTSFGLALTGGKIIDSLTKEKIPGPEKYNGPLSKYHLSPNYKPSVAVPTYYTPSYAAQGGIMSLAMGGPATTPQPGQMYPGSQQVQTRFATPSQMPTSAEVINAGYEPATNPYTGEQPLRMAAGGETKNPLLDFYKKNVNQDVKAAPLLDSGINVDEDPDTRLQDPLTAANTRAKKLAFLTKVTPYKAQSFTPQPITPQLQQAQQQAVEAASGGIMGYNLGGYAAGGRQPRLLKGPGDGMSDNIPATIADRQPARLADGEFVVPADVVSHLGNGSTDAGAKKLHGMMDKVRVARTGKKAQGTEINPNKYLPK